MLCSLMAYPLYYLYILSATGSAKSPKLLYFLIPIILFPVSAAVLYHFMTPEEDLTYIKYFLYEEPYPEELLKLSAVGRWQVIQSEIYSIYFCLQLVVILILVSRALTRYNKQMADYYSNLDNKVLYTPKYLLWIILLISLSSILLSLIGKESFVKASYQLFPSSIYALLLFYVGFISSKFNHDVQLAEDNLTELSKEQEETSDVESNPQKMTVLQEQIVNVIRDDELFKNADLKISDIASMLGTNRTYISRAINQTMNMPFSDLVNKYRIEYALSLMKNREFSQMTLSEIALKSGFSNESTFYRVFKHAMGVSPRQYTHNT
ncbi:MAG: helix-turn-helix transcriptional regulator [Bacteroidales bacterium]|nr:helix-turn-helix transcriptional regulator [Bacteroidales bacterium]MDD4671196.1 helix-turn-helix transcriptional regulator [Bacteroidales bacterium]